jgi:single-stranded DNA-specific DHH superfamily exonuclease
VASALVEKFLLPSVVIGQYNGVIKGSGRSLENINLKHILEIML